MFDIIIIGAGPGGLTAGIYAGRQGTKNLIIDRDLAGGIGREVPEMENYPGFESISGLELIEKMKAQAIKNCDLHEMEEVTKLFKLEPFDIYLIGGGACILGEYTTRATMDIDFVDLGYPSKYGKVFVLLRDYDMLEYQSTILSPYYKERSIKLEEFIKFL